MTKTLGILGGVTALVLLAGAGLWFYVHSSAVDAVTELAHIRTSEYFKAAERGLSLDPPLNAALGGNMKFGDVQLKQAELSDDTGSVTLYLEVTGTNGSGHANVKLVRPEAKVPWKYLGGDYFPQSGPPIHLDAR